MKHVWLLTGSFGACFVATGVAAIVAHRAGAVLFTVTWLVVAPVSLAVWTNALRNRLGCKRRWPALFWLTPVTVPVATCAWIPLTRQLSRGNDAAWYIAATMVMVEGLAMALIPIGVHLVDRSTSFNDADWAGGFFMLGVAALCVVATACLAAAFVGVASNAVRRAA